MIMDEFARLIAVTKKEIDEGKIANEEGIFLKRALEQGVPLNEDEKKLLGQMKYHPTQK